MKRRQKVLTITFVAVLAIVLLGVVGFFQWKRFRYPYGISHCCIKVMGTELRMYAQDHEGRFPSGGKTPEASLALLYSNNVSAELLRGKSVPLAVTRHALEKDGTLTPESTGWHYVDGLTEADNPVIAILWDKIGLDHNGGRRGYREVLLVDGSTRSIPDREWQQFLQKQKELLAKRSDSEKAGLPALRAKIKLPDGNIVEKYDHPYELEEGSARTSGQNPDLRWYRFYEGGATRTFVLTFPTERLRSKPIKLEFKKGQPGTNFIIFEMEKY